MKHDGGKIPPATKARLPQYFQCLRELLLRNCLRATSETIAAEIGVTAAQARSDLRWFDGAGQRGYGYSVRGLYTEIAEHLGIGEGYTAVCIGDDPQSDIMIENSVFGRCGVRILARVSEAEDDEALSARLRELAPDLGVITPGCRAARRVAALFAGSSVKGILNYSDQPIVSIGEIPVQNHSMSEDLLRLCCEIKTKGEATK